ncbi:MAG: ABC transporter permease [Ilumatobacteraceae bacterium]
MTDSSTTEVEVADAAEGLTAEPKSFGRLARERFVRHRLAIAGTIGLVIIAIVFLAGPWWSSWAFDEPNVLNRRAGPSWDHPFGTDTIGRDLFVRTTMGGRYSLTIGALVAVLATVIGTLLGAAAGFFGRWVDAVVSQLINLVLVVPAIIVLSVVALQYGASPVGIAVVLAMLLWTRIARVVRGVVLQFREQEFVMAARAAGAGSGRIVFRHILPNVFGAVIVEITLLIGLAIVLESTLSFLGVGVKPPTPTLGNLVFQAKGDINNDPIRVLLPGMFIVAIVLCVNFLGDGLRDAIDPRSRAAEKE